MIARRQHTLLSLLALAIIGAGCHQQETLAPEAARAKGDALLREMSTNMSALQTFAYTVEERRQNPGGKPSERRVTRHVIVRRPNGIAFTGKGDRGDTAGWYDGKQITLVSYRDKVWARGPMPPTLDEALDFLGAEYDVQMPTADLLYSSPYDAFMTKDTTGGWVDTQKIGDRSCEHLAYRQQVVDWELWLTTDRAMPCQLKMTYKQAPGQPSTWVTYRGLEAPNVTDETFKANVPDGFNRIKILRRATVIDPKLDEPAPGAKAGAKQTK
jgi:hypothetical protein